MAAFHRVIELLFQSLFGQGNLIVQICCRCHGWVAAQIPESLPSTGKYMAEPSGMQETLVVAEKKVPGCFNTDFLLKI
jgi:hypothetical protein